MVCTVGLICFPWSCEDCLAHHTCHPFYVNGPTCHASQTTPHSHIWFYQSFHISYIPLTSYDNSWSVPPRWGGWYEDVDCPMSVWDAPVVPSGPNPTCFRQTHIQLSQLLILLAGHGVSIKQLLQNSSGNWSGMGKLEKSIILVSGAFRLWHRHSLDEDGQEGGP